MRKELDEWRIESKDLGDIPESELVNRWWPNGKQPKTSRPWLIPNAPGNRSKKHIQSEKAQFDGPAMIDVYCATLGASIAYTTEDGDKPYWKLFTGPIRLPKGKTLLRVRAIRYGYKESDETRCVLTVQ